MTRLAVVVIGRNEGERLQRCLESVSGCDARIVYVDSGSSDGSVAVARGLGVEVVELDTSVPFTAARARNEGFDRAAAIGPELEFVQFVDGDCEMIAGWLDRAAAFLDEHRDVAAVAGRLRERNRERTIYNRLCDMEWNVAAGEAAATGGIMMVRADDFRASGGFNPGLIAGEEPELCARLRSAGRRIWRLSDEMAWHDAAMTRFSQWWRRAERGGHAVAEEAAMHHERHAVRRVAGNFAGGAVLPLIAIALAPPTWGLSLAAMCLMVALWSLRIAAHRRRRHGESWADSLLYGSFCVLAKAPQSLGQTRYMLNRLAGRRSKLMEYKAPVQPTTHDALDTAACRR